MRVFQGNLRKSSRKKYKEKRWKIERKINESFQKVQHLKKMGLRKKRRHKARYHYRNN